LGEEAKQRFVVPRSGGNNAFRTTHYAFLRDGLWLAHYHTDPKKSGCICLTDISGAEPTEKLLLELDDPNSPAGNMASAADGALAIQRENRIDLWDCRGARPKTRPALEHPDLHGLTAFALAKSGKLLAVVATTPGRKAAVWDVANKEIVWSWRPPGPVRGLSFSADGRHLVLVNANNTAYIVRLAPAK
jgi:WD40 repeat protein